MLVWEQISPECVLLDAIVNVDDHLLLAFSVSSSCLTKRLLMRILSRGPGVIGR